MPKLSAEKQAERRERLLDAAETCFTRAGFHGASIQSICKEAGVSAGALYVYFQSKEELIRGLSARDRGEVLDAFAKAGTGQNFLKALRDLVTEAVIERPRAKAVILLEIGAEATRNPAIAEVIAECDEAIRSALTGALEQAEAAGVIQPTMPIARIVDLMLSVGDGLLWRRAVHPHVNLHALADDVLALFVPVLGVARPDLPFPFLPEPADSTP